MGNRDEAMRILRSAYQARPDPEIAAHLGEVLWAHGPARRSAPRLARRRARATPTTRCCSETLARLRVDL